MLSFANRFNWSRDDMHILCQVLAYLLVLRWCVPVELLFVVALSHMTRVCFWPNIKGCCDNGFSTQEGVTSALNYFQSVPKDYSVMLVHVIWEEICFRAILFEGMAPYLGVTAARFLCAALFGLAHINSLHGLFLLKLFTSMGASSVLMWMYRAHGLLGSVAVHGAVNLSMVFMLNMVVRSHARLGDLFIKAHVKCRPGAVARLIQQCTDEHCHSVTNEAGDTVHLRCKDVKREDDFLFMALGDQGTGTADAPVYNISMRLLEKYLKVPTDTIDEHYSPFMHYKWAAPVVINRALPNINTISQHEDIALMRDKFNEAVRQMQASWSWGQLLDFLHGGSSPSTSKATAPLDPETSVAVSPVKVDQETNKEA